MLSIYIHNTAATIFNPTGDNGGFLDIPEDAAMTIESVAEAFQETEESGEFSLPIDLNWTDNNRRLLNFKERVENFNRAPNSYICTVYDNGFPEFIKAKLTIISRAGSFAYRQGKFTISISGARGIYATEIKNKKLADLPLGGSITWDILSGINTSRQFAHWHYTTGYSQYPQIRFAPVGFEGFYDQDRYDYNGEFLAKDTVNNIVDKGGGNWEFGRPTSTDPSIPAIAGASEYVDYRTIPFFRLKFLLEKVFTDMGYSVSGEIFSNADLDNLVVFNNYGIERYTVPGILGNMDVNRHIIPANHVPDMLISDFLKAVLPGLGIFISFVDDTTVVLVNHNTDINNAAACNMDDVLVDEFESDFIDGTAAEDGYKIALKADDDDQYYSERMKDISGYMLISRVNTRAELSAFTSGSGLTTIDIVYVAAENMYYAVADATSTPVKFDAFAEGIGDFIVGSGERQVDINFSTLAQYVILDAATGLYTNQGYLGTRQKGTYYTNKGVLVKNKFGLRLFYCTPPGNAAVMPRSYNHNRDAGNAIIEKYTLAPNLAGSIAQLLTPFQDILQNAEVVKVSFIANADVMERLRKYKKLNFAGVQFFLKKIERVIPMGHTVKTEVVPL